MMWRWNEAEFSSFSGVYRGKPPDIPGQGLFLGVCLLAPIGAEGRGLFPPHPSPDLHPFLGISSSCLCLCRRSHVGLAINIPTSFWWHSGISALVALTLRLPNRSPQTRRLSHASSNVFSHDAHCEPVLI